MQAPTRAEFQRMALSWFGSLVAAIPTLTDEERADLDAWEQAGNSTSDWSGWEPLIGRFPGTAIPPLPERARTQKVAIPAALRWEVWERDNFTCLHCGVRRFLTIDHIVPESGGGPTTLANLQTLCRPCNSRKGTQ